jgi:hypothetical protein
MCLYSCPSYTTCKSHLLCDVSVICGLSGSTIFFPYYLIAHTAKIVAKILKRRIEKKIKDLLGEDQLGFTKRKETRDAIGMLRIISERTLETDEELFAS